MKYSASHCPLQAMDELAACPALQHLACADNPLAALEPLPRLRTLLAQRAGVARLADLRPLALAGDLAELGLAGNLCVAGLSPRRRRVLIGNLLPGLLRSCLVWLVLGRVHMECKLQRFPVLL